MSKDDYHVLVLKILQFLYNRLKGKTAKDPEEYLQALTKDFPVQPEYFERILADLTEDGLISGYRVARAWGGDVIVLTVRAEIQITRKGIDYLFNNSNLEKAKQFMKDIKDMIPGL